MSLLEAIERRKRKKALMDAVEKKQDKAKDLDQAIDAKLDAEGEEPPQTEDKGEEPSADAAMEALLQAAMEDSEGEDDDAVEKVLGRKPFEGRKKRGQRQKAQFDRATAEGAFDERVVRTVRSRADQRPKTLTERMQMNVAKELGK